MKKLVLALLAAMTLTAGIVWADPTSWCYGDSNGYCISRVYYSEPGSEPCETDTLPPQTCSQHSPIYILE